MASGLPVGLFRADQIDDVDVCSSDDLVVVSVFGLDAMKRLRWISHLPALGDRRSDLHTAVVAKALPAFEFGFVDTVVHVELLEHCLVLVSSHLWLYGRGIIGLKKGRVWSVESIAW